MEQTVEAVKNNLPGKPALKLNFGAKFYKPFWFKASACRHGEFIERTGAKTIANVRTIGFSDRKIPKVSTYKALFASRACTKLKLSSKFGKVRRGTPALCMPQVFPSYDLPIPRQAS